MPYLQESLSDLESIHYMEFRIECFFFLGFADLIIFDYKDRCHLAYFWLDTSFYTYLNFASVKLSLKILKTHQ